MTHYIKRVLLASFILFVPNAHAQNKTDDLAEKLDQFVEKLNNRLGTFPGFSVSVVQGDKILIDKGYGVANTKTQEPFTKDTYSYLASGTKAFVGLTVAILAERGELDLDAPIGTTYLHDMNQESLGLIGTVSFKQLLNHTHGLSGEAIGLRTAYTGDFTDEQIWYLLRHLNRAETGQAFEYSNLGYVAASYVLEHIYKEPWQTLVARTVLAPAALNKTIFKVSDLLDKSVAQPHQWQGTLKQVPIYKRDKTMHAAGGQYATSSDIARWLLLNLNDGELNGERIWPAAAVQLIRAPLATVDESFYNFHRKTYGLGWYNSDYEGDDLYHHFGAYTGYRVHISMMPKIQLGVSVLSNAADPANGFIPDMIATYVYDIALGKDGVEEKFEAEIKALEGRIAPYKGKTMPQRPRNAPDNEQIYAGHYKNSLVGDWDIRMENNQVRLHWGQLSSDITFTTRNAVDYIRFELTGNGYLAEIIRTKDHTIAGFKFHGEFLKRQ